LVAAHLFSFNPDFDPEAVGLPGSGARAVRHDVPEARASGPLHHPAE
jgi:hypothetical protein